MTIARRHSTGRTSDYKVGYRNPPRHSQFKPGQSGHKEGRPQGVRNLKSLVKATLKAPVRVTSDGSARKVSTLEAMLLRLREKALGGDLRALDRLLQLAQLYCEDELAAAIGVSVEDANVLRIYRQRVLSGAAAGTELVREKDTDEEPSSRSTTVGMAPEPSPMTKESVTRYRSPARGADDSDQKK
jgi:hypothetical protein